MSSPASPSARDTQEHLILEHSFTHTLCPPRRTSERRQGGKGHRKAGLHTVLPSAIPTCHLCPGFSPSDPHPLRNPSKSALVSPLGRQVCMFGPSLTFVWHLVPGCDSNFSVSFPGLFLQRGTWKLGSFCLAFMSSGYRCVPPHPAPSRSMSRSKLIGPRHGRGL